jgi:hypothetical protein
LASVNRVKKFECAVGDERVISVRVHVSKLFRTRM